MPFFISLHILALISPFHLKTERWFRSALQQHIGTLCVLFHFSSSNLSCALKRKQVITCFVVYLLWTPVSFMNRNLTSSTHSRVNKQNKENRDCQIDEKMEADRQPWSGSLDPFPSFMTWWVWLPEKWWETGNQSDLLEILLFVMWLLVQEFHFWRVKQIG